MLQQILKQATQTHHDQLEGLMFVHQIMDGTLTLEQYSQILLTNYKVHQRFEDVLINSVSPQIAAQLNINGRRKLEALEADLAETDQAAPVVDTTDSIKFKNEAEALGALYVLEGATLGGNVIVKRLKVNPNLNHLGLNFNYYQVYGDDLVPNWKQFCEVLAHQPEDTFDDSVNGAKKMFGYIASVQQQNNQITAA